MSLCLSNWIEFAPKRNGNVWHPIRVCQTNNNIQKFRKPLRDMISKILIIMQPLMHLEKLCFLERPWEHCNVSPALIKMEFQQYFLENISWKLCQFTVGCSIILTLGTLVRRWLLLLTTTLQSLIIHYCSYSWQTDFFLVYSLFSHKLDVFCLHS